MQVQGRNSWLFNPAADLLLGCGLLYALVLSAVSVSGGAFLETRPVFLLPLCVLLLSGPHYGATLIRVYENREDRRGYFRVAVVATAVLLGLFVAAVYSPLLSAYLVTLYLTWSPWHYTAQNYGLSVMFLRRNQVEFPIYAKRLLRSTFILSYVTTFVAMHGGDGLAWDPRAAGDTGVAFLSLGIPSAIGRPLVIGLVVANLLAIVAAAVVFLRLGVARQLLPSAALVVSQALWFTAPFTAQFLGVETGIRPIDQQQRVEDYVLLVAMAHAVQYLWVTAYYAKKSPGWHGQTRYYGKAFLAGSAAWTLPVMVVAPDLVGGMAYDAGLSLLLASVVNLHHFILDGEIWKLRQQRVASVLIRGGALSTGPPGVAGPGGFASGWTRRLVWGTCGVGAFVAVWVFVTLHFTFPAAERRADFEAQRRSLDRLAWAGQDISALRFKLARSEARAGDTDAAIASFERGLALQATWPGYEGLANLYQRQGDPGAADATYGAAEERLGTSREILLTRSALWFQQGDQPRSVAFAERALELDSGDIEARIILTHIHERFGDERAALQQARAAWNVRPDSTRTTRRLAWLLATVRDPALRDPGEAVRVIEGSIDSPEDAPPELLDVLAVGYAAQGRFPEAVELGTRAADRADADGNAALAGQIRTRVDLFRDEQAFPPEPSPSG